MSRVEGRLNGFGSSFHGCVYLRILFYYIVLRPFGKGLFIFEKGLVGSWSWDFEIGLEVGCVMLMVYICWRR